VRVGYSDINNTAMLIEIARKTGDYLPDLSFGTHFFQDLVESEIRYLPLYPDDDGFLNMKLLHGSPNLFSAMLPNSAHLEGTIRVIDIPSTNGGRILRVLMNSELDQAIGLLTESEGRSDEARPTTPGRPPQNTEAFWRWRMQMSEKIAAEIDPDRFGVRALYVIGSTKNASAGPASDIDLLVHFRGTEQQRHDLETWLEAWSLSLGEINYQRTGYFNPDLLDVHFITDEDIERKTSFAAKIGAVTDAALELPLGKA
jgi:hypothetical protein